MTTLPAPLAPDAPPGFSHRAYQHTVRVPHGRDAVWAWLSDPATFVDGQVPPYRVEFVGADGGRAGFEEGVWTAHHGPGLLAAGRLGEQRPPAPGRTAYRDLVYAYGSYVGSLRLARPTRLQFWADADGPDATTVRLQLDADVAWAFVPFWEVGMRVFWGGFGDALTEQVGARLSGVPATRWRRRPTLVAAGAALAVGLRLGLRR